MHFGCSYWMMGVFPISWWPDYRFSCQALNSTVLSSGNEPRVCGYVLSFILKFPINFFVAVAYLACSRREEFVFISSLPLSSQYRRGRGIIFWPSLTQIRKNRSIFLSIFFLRPILIACRHQIRKYGRSGPAVVRESAWGEGWYKREDHFGGKWNDRQKGWGVRSNSFFSPLSFSRFSSSLINYF